MKQAIIDTPIWSLALRRQPKSLSEKEAQVVKKFSDMISHGQVSLLGVIRQELLSGISDPKPFSCLSEHLRPFPDHGLRTVHYEEAARCYNACRKNGVQGSLVDFLICGVAIVDRMPIATLDQDFVSYAKYLPIDLIDFGSMIA